MSARLPVILAMAACSVALALGIRGGSLEPDHTLAWTIRGLAPFFLWGLLELLMGASDGRRETIAIRNGNRLTLAGGVLLHVVGAAGRTAELAGWMGEDGMAAVIRTRGILTGAAFVLWGNFLPKALSPWRREDEPFEWQRVHRFVGWLAVLAGLAILTSFVILPLPDARRNMAMLIGVTALLAIGRKAWSVTVRARSGPPTTGETR